MALIAELKRRNVFRVGVAYAIVAWLLVEVASVVLPTFKAPEWVMQVLTFLVILGFPLTLIMAWAFELTPEGIKRDTAANSTEPVTRKARSKLDFAIVGLLVIAVLFMFVDNYVLDAEPEQADATAEQIPATETVEREKSIAVLPFDNISPNPEDAYFADGIHDEILAQISKIRDIKVTSRTSVMRYRGEDKPSSPEIGVALGVANLLEGSVRLAGNRVRITIQFIEAERDAHLWTETYDRELTAANIFSIQSEIATIVADALRATLTPEDENLIDSVPTENMAALEAYFRGKQAMEKRTSTTLAEAVDDFNRAIEHDPNFALAYVGLADSFVLQVDYSGQSL
jgi:TolB-like protein